MYISKVHLENIRCFEEIDLDFNNGSGPILWTTLLGDNSTGKTTLLRSIAIGLCDESSAAGLLKESEEGYIRRDSPKKGEIKITLCDSKGEEKGTIKTTIERRGSKKFSYEHLHQETDGFEPWDDIFICAYGIGRGISGTGDITGYAPISAVYNLFNYSEGLQNPELAIRRVNKKTQNAMLKVLNRILNLEEDALIEVEDDGIKVEGGSWKKKMPLSDLADGHRSTIQWIADFIGWAISFQPKNSRIDSIKGIVLVDAIEEHLHPKWQKSFVNLLKEQFPSIQFITTTHSPIIAKSVGQLGKKEKADNLILLQSVGENNVKRRELDSLKGLDIDQILASEAFDYLLLYYEEDKLLEELSKLASKGKKRTLEEEKKYQEALDIAVSFALTYGVSLFEREVEKKLVKERNEQIKKLEKKVLSK